MLNDEELALINAIFHEYPDKVANIAQHIFDAVPYEEAVYAVYPDGIEPYGLKTNIIDLYDSEVANVKKTRSLPWVLLSCEKDVRDVCDFVQRHIDDGTFEIHESCMPREWVSMIDGRVHKAVPWTDEHFKDYTKIKKSPYMPVTAFRVDDHELNKEELAAINAIFHEYPAKVANIARFILEKSPLDEGRDYGFEGELDALFKKDAGKDAMKELYWHELSCPEDVRRVCDFVLKHIADGSFQVKKDSPFAKEETAFERPFEELTRIVSYSYEVTGEST